MADSPDIEAGGAEAGTEEAGGGVSPVQNPVPDGAILFDFVFQPIPQLFDFSF